jgi:uncharacterized membrane protein YgdD (TMEM256/DUF423 family)
VSRAGLGCGRLGSTIQATGNERALQSSTLAPEQSNRLAKKLRSETEVSSYSRGMQRWIWVACASGFAAVALGAFGAHALKARLSADLLAVYQTGVLYHLIHSVALWSLALHARASGASITLPASLFTAGIVLFSGSLYLLALSGVRALGAVTPIGGLCFLGAWATAAWTLTRSAP